jgi:biopolymer transport protein TolR
MTRTLSSEINVTPLVDVCLVLLIIFMVITPLLPKGDVLLPETNDPSTLPETPGQLTISVKRDGSIFVREARTRSEDLVATLSGIYAASPDRKVVAKGDRRLQYKRVREVMRLIREAGFQRAVLVTEGAVRSAA